MRSPRFATFLTLFNLVLLGGILLWWRGPATQPVPSSAIPASVAQWAAPSPKSRLVEVTTVQTNEFHWEQLESEDYRSYIQRLRAIGCPEQTIKDIVIADVDKLMAPQISSASVTKREPKYWQDDERELIPPSAFLDEKRQKREIDFQKRELLQELLGTDLAAERARTLGEEDHLGQRLTFLSDDKKSKVRMIMERYSEEEVALREKSWLEGETLSTEDQAKIRELQNQQTSEIASLLTPAEMEQYQLWHSPVAQRVRSSMFGMNATEREFLSLYKLQQTYAETWSEDKVDLNDPQTRLDRDEAEAELNRSIEAALGPKRFAEYVRAQDPDFHQLSIAAAQFQLPAHMASDVYEMKRAAMAEQESIVTDESLSKRQKKIALDAVADQTASAARTVLGDRAFNFFKRHAQGGWLGDVGEASISKNGSTE